MEVKVTFPGGKRVDAEIGGHVIATDQPVAAGGTGAAPTPFECFLASLATCAGIYVLSFCQERGIGTDGLSLAQRMEFSEETGKKRLSKVAMEITLPAGFPEKYRNAIVKTAGLCTVKKVLLDPPEFEIYAR